MQSGAGTDQQVGAMVQIEVVVAVAAVEAAACGGNQPAVAEQPQMVGDQILRLAHQTHQLTDPVIAGGQFGQ